MAAVPNTQESWDNISALLWLLNLDSLGHTFNLAVDMKVQLILVGKQSAAARHACPYCECYGEYNCDCPSYTFSSLQQHLTNFQADGADLKAAKKFTNVVNPALISGPPDRRIIEVLNFSELHFMTGVVGKLIGELIKVFSNTQAGQEFVDSFMRTHNIKWCLYQPNSFEGNQAKKMIDHSSDLKLAARELPQLEAEEKEKVLGFCSTLEEFKKVVDAAFGQKLDPSFRESIASFSASYRQLGISVTPKVHCVERHLSEFLEHKGLQAGLGYYSEQAMETAHADFKVEWERVKVGPNHQDYAKQLFGAILRGAFNSYSYKYYAR